MADFSFLSDTDDSAVEELISQAQDLCVLEQVSAINCSGFTDSVLPFDLESRFGRLKSLPLTKPKLNSSNSLSFNASTARGSPLDSKSQLNHSGKGKAESDLPSDDDAAILSSSKRDPGRKVDSSDFSSEKCEFTHLKKNSDHERGLKAKSKCEFTHFSPLSNSPRFTVENDAISSPFKSKRDGKKFPKATFDSEPFSSPLDSSNSLRSSSSPSPPRKTGCFWCSPKKASQRKSRENVMMENGFDWGRNDEFLSDLRIFSTKEQQKILKKAMKEEEKINREAEKIVEWAKQASARMSASGIEDELSDEESIK